MEGIVRSAAAASLCLWLLCACGDAAAPRPPPRTWSTDTRLLTRAASGRSLQGEPHTHDNGARHGVRVSSGDPFEVRLAVPTGGVLGFSAERVGTGADERALLAVDQLGDSQRWQPLLRPTPVAALETHRVDLSAWAGRELKLRFRVEGRAGTTVFVGEPAIFVPSDAPRRVVLIFVDTLRPDHLGFLGYERDTSPGLDALARDSAVFEVARAPAPWTLPSARAALSGRQPEAWETSPHLGELLAAHGFITLATTSNAFLGPAFGMGRGWTEYQMHSKAIASAVVDRALTQLERYEDRDVLMLVHFMDPHVPYREPPAYHGFFDRKGLPDRSEPREPGATIERRDLIALDPTDPGFERERRYILDRYDQTIRYLDDELGRLLEAIGPDATVVLFSDHGEEFWEHGSAEHGHTLFEELLRVPLVVRDRALPPGRHRVPASLLDIVPTVLELVGLPAASSDGLSLVGVAREAPGAEEALLGRPEAFGRMLYGGERWSVRRGDRKWSTWAGRQILVDLAEDRDELQDLSTRPDADLPSYVALLSEVLGREVDGAWRVLLGLPPTDRETRVRISHPDGIAFAWPHRDPLGRRSGSTLSESGAGVELLQPAGATAPPTLTLIPGGSVDEPRGLQITIESGEKRFEGRVEQSPPPFRGGEIDPLLRIGDGTHGALVLPAWAPRPVYGVDPVLEEDVREALKELGYLE